MNAEINLLIGIPTMGSVHPILVSRLLKWAREFPEGQVHFYFSFKVAPVDRARNQIVEYFLKHEFPDGRRFTHLFFIDSDTIPPPDAVKRLFSHEKEIVTGLTPILTYVDNERGWASYDNAFIGRDTDENGKVLTTNIARRGTGLQEVFRCGAACMLISRGVFEKIDKPYYRFVPNDDNTKHVRSEDIDFCDRVTKAGFHIYADTDVACQHYKDIML